ncbi:MAG: hypothetical protein CMP59_05660 [Flavobacteriales bacterium]|nr:hypothetical protein [Flavobacteriales bacterium]|tara:strand:+ start:621 stop:965 length:345 start_codon:yes stop_codon:yes gene_type:complete
MNEVEEYILRQSEGQREVMLYLHELFVREYNLSPKIKYGIPFYFGNKWVCYLNPRKIGDIDLTFLRGSKIKGFDGVLETRDRKMVKSLVLDVNESIDEDLIHQLMALAMELDNS